MASLSAVLFSIISLLRASEVSATSLRAGSRSTASRLDSYSFPQFLQDFSRSYASESKEYAQRSAVFQASLERVRALNAKNTKEGRSWKAGLHPFMDWTEEERQGLMGYKPSRAQGHKAASVSFLHSSARAFARSNATRRDDDEAAQGGLTTVEDGPLMRNQGNCGSCWAISAVEAVEAQLQRNGVGKEVQLSPQALIDCVPNPQHCGGSGGCDGATGELAYSYMRDHGIPVETALPYQAETQQCPGGPVSGQRAVVSGFAQLPSNKAQPLKEALVSQGPVVVAVDGNPWFDYEQGIFDGCSKDAVLGHAVLAKGYAEEDGKKYWLIQNSWGHGWGEQGHIRLTRRDDDDNYCGTDKSPKEGVGCDGGPSEVTVCGECGILFDPVVPQGARLVDSA